MQTIADVVEAILAAALLSGGHEVALQAARRLQVNVPNVAQWADYARLAAEHGTCGQHAGPLPARDTLEAVERIFGSQFRRPELVGQALVSAPSKYSSAYCDLTSTRTHSRTQPRSTRRT